MPINQRLLNITLDEMTSEKLQEMKKLVKQEFGVHERFKYRESVEVRAECPCKNGNLIDDQIGYWDYTVGSIRQAMEENPDADCFSCNVYVHAWTWDRETEDWGYDYDWMDCVEAITIYRTEEDLHKAHRNKIINDVHNS